MKISIFVDSHVFDNEFQGSRTFIKEMYLIIAQQTNFEIYFAANDVDNLEKEFESIKNNKNVHFIAFESKNKFQRLFFETPALIKKYQIDYAHFQYVIPPRVKCKYIVTIHDVLFLDFPQEFSWTYRLSKKILFKFAAKRSHIITTVSDYSRKAISKHFTIDQNRIVITPNGVADRFLSKIPKETSINIIKSRYNIESYILYISRFEPRKNQQLALKAFLDLKLYEKGYHLVLLGHKSSEVKEFEEILQQQTEEIKATIFISSEVTDADLIHFYSAASLFLYPSKAEGFGIPPLEAGAMEIPVICSNETAMSDFTFFGRNHLNPTDYTLWKKQIEENLFTERNEIELKMISTTIKENYSWENSAQTLISIIQKDLQ